MFSYKRAASNANRGSVCVLHFCRDVRLTWTVLLAKERRQSREYSKSSDCIFGNCNLYSHEYFDVPLMGQQKVCNWSMFISVLMLICFPTALLMRSLTISHEERPALCWSCWSSQWIRRHLSAESRNQITAVINFSLCGYLIRLQTECIFKLCFGGHRNFAGCLRHPWLEEKDLIAWSWYQVFWCILTVKWLPHKIQKDNQTHWNRNEIGVFVQCAIGPSQFLVLNSQKPTRQICDNLQGQWPWEGAVECGVIGHHGCLKCFTHWASCSQCLSMS